MHHLGEENKHEVSSIVICTSTHGVMYCTVRCGSDVPCTVHMWYVSFNLDKIMRLYGVNSESYLG